MELWAEVAPDEHPETFRSLRVVDYDTAIGLEGSGKGVAYRIGLDIDADEVQQEELVADLEDLGIEVDARERIEDDPNDAPWREAAVR